VTAARALSAAVARRFLVRRHLLAPPRSLPAEPGSVMRVVDRLGSLQFDPIDVAGRNHDLTLLARIDGYRREWTDGLLYRDRVLYETYNKQFSLVPTAELPWYRITWDRNRVAHGDAAFDEHAPLVEELLERIRTGGAMSATDIEPRAAIDWYWRPTNPVRAILEALAEAGVLAISSREGNRRIYDLTERLFPPELLAQRPPEREQLLHKLMSRYRGNGLLGLTGEYTIFAGLGLGPQRRSLQLEAIERGLLTAVEVEGLRGPRYVVTEELPLLDEAAAEIDAGGPPGGGAPGVAFLAPLDPLAWDRDLLLRLWGFDYRWEVYVPAPKRRWGYYVLPVLWGDRLVGRIELRADRPARALRVVGLWWEAGFDPLDAPGFVAAFAAAVMAHRDFGDVDAIELPKGVAHRPFVSALRGALEMLGYRHRARGVAAQGSRRAAVGRLPNHPAPAGAGRRSAGRTTPT